MLLGAYFMVSVIFPAAGQGKRMQAGLNKVFLELAGKPILVHTLLKFSKVSEVGELIVVVGSEEVAIIEQLLKDIAGLKPYKVVAGGSERQYSVLNGLKCASQAADVVLVHDAARPLVSMATIENVITAARKYGGAIAAVPEKNTIKEVVDGVVVNTPDRSSLWAVQTPQGFWRDILFAANEKAMQDNFLGTDDASLVERLGKKVHIVMSDYRNIKLTTPEDLIMAEAFMQESTEKLASKVQAAAKIAKENFDISVTSKKTREEYDD